MESEFWMPEPASRPVDRPLFVLERLTAEEKAVLRRLLRGDRARKRARRLSPRRERHALRQRRQLLDRLAGRDLHSLVRIVLELKL